MKKVEYPSKIEEIRLLKSNYYKKLELRDLEQCWRDVRARIPGGHSFPKKLSKIVLADFHHLCIYYSVFTANSARIAPADKTIIDTIFDYGKMHNAIAAFFMDKSNGFHFSTCHYCELAFINSYETDSTGRGLFFINNADVSMLKKKLRLTSDKIPLQIIELRKRKSLSVIRFNSLFPRSDDKFGKVFPEESRMNHFDLDHVLDKGSCPITALSLFNFVPSCPICNERLKHSQSIVVGINGCQDESLSPTSPLYDFDSNATFKIIPKDPNQIFALKEHNAKSFELKLDVTPKYYNIKEIFKLEERYNYHKMVALHWSDMKYRYSKNTIAMMANALHNPSYSAKRIEEDIFQKKLDKEGKSCFEKLKRDMLK